MTDPAQPELPLPAPALPADMPPLPARMVNEYRYCPRLAYLEWVQGEWAESADTVEGRARHRRVDRPGGAALPEAEAIGEEDRLHARSVTLASERLGLVARVDLIEVEDGAVTPVDYKRGKRPHVAGGAYAPERVQLCVQGLLLEERGYRCEEGVLYFVESRERVRVPFDADLRAETLAAVHGLRLVAAAGRAPPPLDDSPKCPRCSLVAICLPDEVNFLARPGAAPSPRPLGVARDTALPLYVQAQTARVRKRGEVLEIEQEDAPAVKARLIDVSQLVLMGNVSVTTPCLHELMRREIPVTWHSYGGWFLGHTVSTGHANAELRIAQYRAAFDERRSLALARGLVEAKIRNCRTLLRRNWRGANPPETALAVLRREARQALKATGAGMLLGIEGSAAATYFGQFAGMLKGAEGDAGAREGTAEGAEGAEGGALAFDFAGRNRRPPTDPVNALLSYAYSLLVRTITVTLSAVGFDPYCGFYHRPRFGRPALALDLMEPFRPLIAESVVLQAVNNGEVRARDFVSGGGGVALRSEGRKRFIAAFERRLSHEVTHPLFGYRVSYRRLIEVQARLLGRHLMGEIPDYPNFTTR